MCMHACVSECMCARAHFTTVALLRNETEKSGSESGGDLISVYCESAAEVLAVSWTPSGCFAFIVGTATADGSEHDNGSLSQVLSHHHVCPRLQKRLDQTGTRSETGVWSPAAPELLPTLSSSSGELPATPAIQAACREVGGAGSTGALTSVSH